MNKVKNIFFFIIKTSLALVVFLTLILFFYTAFFYEPPSIEKKNVENKIKEKTKKLKEEKKLEPERSEKTEKKETQKEEKTSDKEQTKTDVKQVQTTIKDGLYITVGNRAITKSDIVNEIKIILILNNESYSSDRREQLQKMAVKTTIARTIKEIAIEQNNFLEFSKDDFMNELTRLASRINVDVETLKNICASNDLDFELIESQIKTELLWNSLIFQLYGSRLSINVEEIEEQLNIIQNKKEAVEYLISEIVIKPVEKDKFKSVINELKNKIKIEGFEKVATKLSISKTGEKGGDLGWLNENVILEKYLSEIVKTQVGKISEPIIVPDGILIFKIRDKRNIKRNLEEEKNKLVNAEKTKILKMHASSHYDKLKRSVSIKFLNE